MTTTNKLYEKYGFVELVEGDLLWHENDNFPNMNRELFLITDTRHSENVYGKKLYEFKVIQPVKLLTPFKVLRNTRANSDFCELYKSCTQNTEISNNVVFKQNIQKRRELMRWFEKQGIVGWVSPIERELYKLEVCLFSPSKYIEPNCSLNKNQTKETKLIGFVGTKNKLNVAKFTKARKENSQYNQMTSVLDYSLYDHYIS